MKKTLITVGLLTTIMFGAQAQEAPAKTELEEQDPQEEVIEARGNVEEEVYESEEQVERAGTEANFSSEGMAQINEADLPDEVMESFNYSDFKEGTIERAYEIDGAALPQILESRASLSAYAGEQLPEKLYIIHVSTNDDKGILYFGDDGESIASERISLEASSNNASSDVEEEVDNAAYEAEETVENAAAEVEEAAQETEDAVDEADAEMEEAADETEEAVENTATEVEESAEEASDEMEESTALVEETADEAAYETEEAVENAATEVGEAGEEMEETTNEVESAASEATRETEDAIDDAGAEMEEAATETENAVEEGTAQIEEAAEETAHETEEAVASASYVNVENNEMHARADERTLKMGDEFGSEEMAMVNASELPENVAESFKNSDWSEGTIYKAYKFDGSVVSSILKERAALSIYVGEQLPESLYLLQVEHEDSLSFMYVGDDGEVYASEDL